ncbi:MAG TPA: hypothetical protein VNS63_05485, partial [Blastocatellia bacterium]|nr:hypothetical protein [Blastocatellia bacterium]
MKFIFTRRFFVLLAVGLAFLSFGWISPIARYFTILYDLGLIVVAAIDYLMSEKASDFRIERELEDRFAMGAENRVTVQVSN